MAVLACLIYVSLDRFNFLVEVSRKSLTCNACLQQYFVFLRQQVMFLNAHFVYLMEEKSHHYQN